MASPFPGMDPYLEGPMWSMVHNSLIEEIARQLTPKLWPRYKVRPGERVVVAPPDEIEMIRPRDRLPDVAVLASDEGSTTMPQIGSATVAPIIRELLEPPPSVIQTFVEIRACDGGQLVTAIEVLSPGNKRGSGAAEYQTKRREVLISETHLLEIDLLRIGERFPVSGPLPSVSYFVFLSRVDLRPRIEIWPVSLDSPLPTVPIPLTAPDHDAELDLQLALKTVYDFYHYDSDIDYSCPPMIPLAEEQAEWADKRLTDAGWR
jgi:hypothetical protein